MCKRKPKPATKKYYKIENLIPLAKTFNQIAKFLRTFSFYFIIFSFFFLFCLLLKLEFFPSDLPQEVRKVLTISALHFGIGCHMLLNATAAHAHRHTLAGAQTRAGATVRRRSGENEDEDEEDPPSWTSELATRIAWHAELSWRRTLAGIFSYLL